MRANILAIMKKLTYVLICLIGVALISYVVISLCFSDWSKHKNKNSSTNSSLPSSDDNKIENTVNSNNQKKVADEVSGIQIASIGITDKHSAETTTLATIGKLSTTALPKTTTKTTTTPKPITTTEYDLEISSTATFSSEAPTTEATSASFEETSEKQSNVDEMIEDVPILDELLESKLGVFEKAAVCSDKEVCSEIGSKILKDGGSAVDSAIATLLCNGIVTLQSLGIGGGMLMNVYIKENQHAYSIDAREVASFESTPEMFDNNPQLSLHGGLSIAVPGELMGIYRAHERFGKLEWKKLIEPSIKLCSDGFYMTKHQWITYKESEAHLQNDTILKKMFWNNKINELLPIGTKIHPPEELCKTYKILAENGALAFYMGPLAELIAEDLKELGSTVTLYDLEAYTADLVSSITMQLGNDILYVVPPVSSGTVVANILSVLEGYNFTKADLSGAENEALTIHRFAEAMKFGFAKRWELGDLRFNDLRELVSKITNPENNIGIRAQINDSSVLNSIYDYGAQFSGNDDVGTSHISVLAPNGDAVSVTSSINGYYGSGLVGKRTGIIFNNGMNDFTTGLQSNQFGLPPAPSNYADAHKRAMSSMSPMILADQEGNVRMIVGAAGGSKIITSIVEVMARVLWFNESIKEAIDSPRFHHQLVPNVLQINDLKGDVLKLLEAKGHKVVSFRVPSSNVCGIVRNDTAVYANADYRKGGGIAGF